MSCSACEERRKYAIKMGKLAYDRARGLFVPVAKNSKTTKQVQAKPNEI
jgi:hypothetical protein